MDDPLWMIPISGLLSPLRSGCLVTSLRYGCPPWVTRLTVPFTMALTRGCSLPLISPFGLPAAGSVGSHSSQNVSPYGLLMQPTAQPPCCLVPSQRPLACVRSRSVDSQDLPTCSSFGAALRQSIIDLSQRSRFALRANLRLVYLDLSQRSRFCI